MDFSITTLVHWPKTTLRNLVYYPVINSHMWQVTSMSSSTSSTTATVPGSGTVPFVPTITSYATRLWLFIISWYHLSISCPLALPFTGGGDWGFGSRTEVHSRLFPSCPGLTSSQDHSIHASWQFCGCFHSFTLAISDYDYVYYVRLRGVPHLNILWNGPQLTVTKSNEDDFDFCSSSKVPTVYTLDSSLLYRSTTSY